MGLAAAVILSGMAAAPVPAAAQTNAADPGTIIVTGERVKRSLKETSSSVTVTTARDIEASGADRGEQVLALVPNVQLDVKEGTAQLVALEEGTTLAAVVRALNALGASPRDIIAIMQALKAAGALRADIVIL